MDAARRRLGEGVEQALGDVGCLGGVVEPVAHHDELVAAEPGDHVTGAHLRPQASGGFQEQLVPDVVAEGVVHDLEAVEVEEQHGEAGPRRPLARQPVGEVLDQEVAVGEVRQLVVLGLVAQGGSLAVRGDGRGDLRPDRGQDRLDALRGPDVLSVGDAHQPHHLTAPLEGQHEGALGVLGAEPGTLAGRRGGRVQPERCPVAVGPAPDVVGELGHVAAHRAQLAVDPSVLPRPVALDREELDRPGLHELFDRVERHVGKLFGGGLLEVFGDALDGDPQIPLADDLTGVAVGEQQLDEHRRNGQEDDGLTGGGDGDEDGDRGVGHGEQRAQAEPGADDLHDGDAS